MKDVIDWNTKCNKEEFKEEVALAPWHTCNIFDDTDDNYWMAETLHKGIRINRWIFNISFTVVLQ